MSDNSPKTKRRTFGIVLAIAFTGPIIGFILAAFGIVLAPKWIFITILLYFSVLFIGVLIGIIALFKKWIGWGGFALALGLLALMTIFYLAILPMLSPLPNGMTNCEAIDTPPPQVRYSCVSISSDSDYHEEIIIEGREGWLLMRIVR